MPNVSIYIIWYISR